MGECLSFHRARDPELRINMFAAWPKDDERPVLLIQKLDKDILWR